MVIMGMKTYNYYLTWFIRYLLSYLILALIGAEIVVIAFKYVPY